MFGIFYNYIDEQEFLCSHMTGSTIYTSKEIAYRALKTQYGNDRDYTVEELEIMNK